MTDLILVLLIPVAYYVGKYTQWRANYRRSMRMRRREW